MGDAFADVAEHFVVADDNSDSHAESLVPAGVDHE